VLKKHLTPGDYSVSTKSFNMETQIYDAPNVGILRRIERPDGISFLTNVLHEQNGVACPGSVEVELQLTTHRGTLAITMRRVARKPDSWHCSTSTIHLPPDAAADLAHSIKSLEERLRAKTQRAI
jgi:hypothetical protein